VTIFDFYGLSVSMLSLTLREVDLSFAYALWSGAGNALIATVGILWFREPMGALTMVSLGLIVIGVAGLHLSTGVR